MSEPRIGLVAEGPTDYELINAALKAILQRPFILTLLQPEPSLAALGNGWGGVLNWCDAASQRHVGSLDTDPTLALFDLLIIHLDLDVALKQYADYSQALAAEAIVNNWPALPCNQPCPPVANTCAALQSVLLGWLGNAQPGNKTVLCLPAQSTGAWLVAAILPATHALCIGIECNPAAEAGLAHLPKAVRVKSKSVFAYRTHAPAVSTEWAAVKAVCSRAGIFEVAVLAVLP
jgi:hypothetical protein